MLHTNTTPAQRILLPVLVGSLMLLAACGGGTGDGPVRAAYEPGREQPATTETAVANEDPEPSGGGESDRGPRNEREFFEAESEREAEHEGPSVVPPPDLTSVDRTDPERVAANWGCAYRYQIGDETSDEWVDRVSTLATGRALDKIAELSIKPMPSTTSSRVLGAAELDDGTWRANCDTQTFNADGELILNEPPTPVLVRLKETDDGWAVSDFSYGGIGFGPIDFRGG